MAATTTQTITSPPPPPNPSEDTGLIPRILPLDTGAIPSPPVATAEWDANNIPAEVAMKMLCRSLESLAAVTGEVPPTPPIQRPSTPRLRVQSPSPFNPFARSDPDAPSTPTTPLGRMRGHMRTASRPATPVPDTDIRSSSFQNIDMGSPEACFSEPSAAVSPDSSESPSTPQIPRSIQQEAIARKFFSKAPPPVSLDDYMTRLQRYCPMSTAVYLAAGSYIYTLSVEQRLVPVTSRTVHRLVLASLRVAMKALEDLRYPQERFAGVGGVKVAELRLLEISLCYLTDFELQVDNDMLYKKTVGLQQAALQATLMRSRRQEVQGMKLMMPVGRVKNLAQTA